MTNLVSDKIDLNLGASNLLAGEFGLVWGISQLETEEQIKSILTQITAQMGFDHFLYGGRFVIGPLHHTDRVLSNYPSEWRALYDQQGLMGVDPVVTHCMQKLTPLLWQPSIYVTNQQLAFREEAVSFGLVSGASFPVHSKEGHIGVLSFGLSAGFRQAENHIRQHAAWGSLIATFVHDAMQRLAKKTHAGPSATLTNRERECLKWVAGGKTSWEISKILGISEHGVIHHVRNVMTKLDVNSRHLAVARATVYNLI
ncbi:MAG: LuxR family transcriptional regulator [Rhodanobacter sp.]